MPRWKGRDGSRQEKEAEERERASRGRSRRSGDLGAEGSPLLHLSQPRRARRSKKKECSVTSSGLLEQGTHFVHMGAGGALRCGFGVALQQSQTLGADFNRLPRTTSACAWFREDWHPLVAVVRLPSAMLLERGCRNVSGRKGTSQKHKLL